MAMTAPARLTATLHLNTCAPRPERAHRYGPHYCRPNLSPLSRMPASKRPPIAVLLQPRRRLTCIQAKLSGEIPDSTTLVLPASRQSCCFLHVYETPRSKGAYLSSSRQNISAAPCAEGASHYGFSSTCSKPLLRGNKQLRPSRDSWPMPCSVGIHEPSGDIFYALHLPVVRCAPSWAPPASQTCGEAYIYRLSIWTCRLLEVACWPLALSARQTRV